MALDESSLRRIRIAGSATTSTICIQNGTLELTAEEWATLTTSGLRISFPCRSRASDRPRSCVMCVLSSLTV